MSTGEVSIIIIPNMHYIYWVGKLMENNMESPILVSECTRAKLRKVPDNPSSARRKLIGTYEMIPCTNKTTTSTYSNITYSIGIQ